MKLNQLPNEIRNDILPSHQSDLKYECLGCGCEFDINELLYTCPNCGEVLLIVDKNFDALKNKSPEKWRQLLDCRRMLNIPAYKGIYRYHEFIGPILSEKSIVYLGEGHTPMVEANPYLQEKVGVRFYFKNDGQNPSASFKDRGMASALSYIQYLIQQGYANEVLSICASTGDTSAAAALYASYLKPLIKSAVLLPHGKVTPQQLSQPLGSGAHVFEIPGVFDDCMKVVEALSENYVVALLNSKNAWRILGQESYSYEIAQDFDYDMKNKVIVVPIGNAGNITAIMSGFMKFFELGIITELPKIIGVQSAHANPVFSYYQEKDPAKRKFTPVTVKPSVAQAAMIGNPVSMPRVIVMVEKYNALSKKENVFVTEVAEQDIMDWELLANQNGHIACTQGGEALAGLIAAQKSGFLTSSDIAIVDSTAHALKFSGFQELYFSQNFPAEFEVKSKKELVNQPQLVKPATVKNFPSTGHPLEANDFQKFVGGVSADIAERLNLQKK